MALMSADLLKCLPSSVSKPYRFRLPHQNQHQELLKAPTPIGRRINALRHGLRFRRLRIQSEITKAGPPSRTECPYSGRHKMRHRMIHVPQPRIDEFLVSVEIRPGATFEGGLSHPVIQMSHGAAISIRTLCRELHNLARVGFRTCDAGP